MNKKLESIGRIETLKMAILGAALTFILPTIAAVVTITIKKSFKAVSFSALINSFQDKWTIIHLVVSFFILSLSIYFLGPWTSIEIIKKKKNKFSTGFTTFFTLWVIYFFTYITIEGIRISNRTGQPLVTAIFNTWVPITMLLFAVVAIPTSLVLGYLLGKRIGAIKNRLEKV